MPPGVWILTVVALTAVSVACGRDGSDSRRPPDAARFVAVDYAFAGPDTLAAGRVSMRLVNQGASVHHAVLARLDPGRSLEDVLATYSTQRNAVPTWLVFVGGPSAAAPGDSVAVISTLEPGTYVLMCFIDDGDHIMHLTKGMMKTITVVERDDPSTSPVATAEIRMSDYAFDVAAPIEAGQHVVRVVNDGPQPHELGVVKLDAGVTAQQFLSTFRPRPAPGSLQGRLIGGVGLLSPGETALWPVTLDTGSYVLVCFVPDVGDGRPHLAHGMIREFIIPNGP